MKTVLYDTLNVYTKNDKVSVRFHKLLWHIVGYTYPPPPPPTILEKYRFKTVCVLYLYCVFYRVPHFSHVMYSSSIYNTFRAYKVKI